MNQAVNPTPVRSDQRVQCALNASVRINESIGEAVQLSRGAGEGDGSVKVTIVDASRAGLGMVSPVFMPRGAKLDVKMTLGGGADFTVVARVQRVEMRDRTPSFYLGLAVSGSSSQPSNSLEALVNEISSPRPIGAKK